MMFGNSQREKKGSKSKGDEMLRVTKTYVHLDELAE